MLRGFFIVHVCRGLWVILLIHSSNAFFIEARPETVYLVHCYQRSITGSSSHVLCLLLRGEHWTPATTTTKPRSNTFWKSWKIITAKTGKMCLFCVSNRRKDTKKRLFVEFYEDKAGGLD